VAGIISELGEEGKKVGLAKQGLLDLPPRAANEQLLIVRVPGAKGRHVYRSSLYSCGSLPASHAGFIFPASIASLSHFLNSLIFLNSPSLSSLRNTGTPVAQALAHRQTESVAGRR